MSARSKLQLSSTSPLRLGNGQGEVCLAVEQMLSLSVPAAAVLRHKPALPWAEIGSFSEQEVEESIITNGTCCQSELRALVATLCAHSPPAPCLHTPVLDQHSCWDLTSPQHLIHDLIFPKSLSTKGTTPHRSTHTVTGTHRDVSHLADFTYQVCIWTHILHFVLFV